MDYCYLTTTGRVSGEPREIEIWFGHEGKGTIYLLAGGGEAARWVRNARKTPAVTVRIGERRFRGVARVLEAGSGEDELARRLLFEKYTPRYSGDLTGWAATALPLAIDLKQQPGA
ncbi:MAG: nitroreductase family deazaflavin-dependent oxidoreductase [Chloroflexi bacterium]|nr:nitroreductase family deazaflavin-dependent oxidoreductase [Chloroflexota bacterium]